MEFFVAVTTCFSFALVVSEWVVGCSQILDWLESNSTGTRLMLNSDLRCQRVPVWKGKLNFRSSSQQARRHWHSVCNVFIWQGNLLLLISVGVRLGLVRFPTSVAFGKESGLRNLSRLGGASSTKNETLNLGWKLDWWHWHWHWQGWWQR